MPSLLIVDDEPNVCYSLEKALRSEKLEIRTALTAGEALESVRRDPPDAVILDVRLPDMSGLEAYRRIRQIDARLPVIVVTAHGTTDTAIEAMKLGAFEYLLKPPDLPQLRDVVARAVHLSRITRLPAMYEEVQQAEGDQLVGRAATMQELYKSIGRIAPQDVTVLVCGESGTGKELVARAIYQHSRRSQAPFLAINCAAIPEPLLESELFGHERGSFTGADRRRIGKFEQADGGTLFMDEVGDMAPATQAKLLRLLQEQQFERVGGNTTIRSDIRVIAATNQDLAALAAAGRFRQDLFYRLNVLSILIPPLRERTDDIPLLVEYFLGRMNRELQRHVRAVAPEAMQLLMQHVWPGNVRELQSAVKYALVHSAGDVLTPECLPPQVREPAGPPAEPGALDVVALARRLLAHEGGNVYYQVQAAVDRALLDEVLRHVKGNQVEAAERLGISRNTLRSKLRAAGLVVEKQVNEAPET
ncbi:MAG: sigma-54 dependent transcriptional regulator [Thermoguttaceae bacterium]|jgi:two-component system nitrogen regulation response regulator GlnG